MSLLEPAQKVVCLDAFAAARLWAANAMPYLSAALFALVPQVRTDVGRTVGVTPGFRVTIHPAVATMWSTEAFGAVLIHEIHHLVRDHATRARGMGVDDTAHDRWNIAADAEINDDLTLLPLPPGVTPATLGLAAGELAEVYYTALDGRQLPHGAGCGSGATGILEPGDTDDPAVDAGEAVLIRQIVAQDIARAQRAGGQLPSGIVRWAEAWLHPTVDWRRILAASLRSAVGAAAGAVDYSYARPNRRQGSPIGRSVILPVLVQPVPRLSVVVDTSGSVDDHALCVVLSEVQGILRVAASGRSRLRLISCDTVVHTNAEVFDVRRIRLAGGGGTDLGPGIDAACARPRPDVVVVLTDGLTTWPLIRPPVTRIIIGLIGNHEVPIPAWANAIRLG